MKNKIREAIEANDITRVRVLLIESMSKNAGKSAALTEISETVSSLKDLFEPDNGKAYPGAHEMTEVGLKELTEDLHQNFSLPKYRLFTEVHARIARDPEFSLSEEPEVTENLEASPLQPQRPRSITKTIGFILMILGAACSIVGICTGVKFMIGLGIGVIMLGSAIVYSGIPRSSSSL